MVVFFFTFFTLFCIKEKEFEKKKPISPSKHLHITKVRFYFSLTLKFTVNDRNATSFSLSKEDFVPSQANKHHQ